MEELLNELLEKELDWIESKKLDLTEKVYPYLPESIKRTSDLTDIPEETLVRSCVRAARHYDLTWHKILDIVRSFYLAKRSLEKEAEEQASGSNR